MYRVPLLFTPTPNAAKRVLEFFTAQINNDHSRKANMNAAPPLCGMVRRTRRLRLHDGKSRVYRTADGVTFLGWRILPDRRRLARRNVISFRRRILALQRQYERGEIEWKDVAARLQAWNAHASHGDTWALRQQIFSQHPFSRMPPE